MMKLHSHSLTGVCVLSVMFPYSTSPWHAGKQCTAVRQGFTTSLSFQALLFSKREDPLSDVITLPRGVCFNGFLEVSEPHRHALLTQKHTKPSNDIKYCDISLLLKTVTTSNTEMKLKHLSEIKNAFYRFMCKNGKKKMGTWIFWSNTNHYGFNINKMYQMAFSSLFSAIHQIINKNTGMVSLTKSLSTVRKNYLLLLQ